MPGKKGEDAIIARTRAAGYDGPLVMGEISDSVRMIEPAPLDGLPNLDSKQQVFP